MSGNQSDFIAMQAFMVQPVDSWSTEQILMFPCASFEQPARVFFAHFCTFAIFSPEEAKNFKLEVALPH